MGVVPLHALVCQMGVLSRSLSRHSEHHLVAGPVAIALQHLSGSLDYDPTCRKLDELAAKGNQQSNPPKRFISLEDAWGHIYRLLK